MNRETTRQILLLFLNMFKDMGYTSMSKTNEAGMEVGIEFSLLINNLEANEDGAVAFLDEIVLRYTGDESRRALQDLVESIRYLDDENVLGDPGVASAIREAEAVLGVKIER